MATHGKTKTHKRQHFVPQCYTKAWHDPTAPVGPRVTPYVWLFDRDGSNPRNKAPAKIFTETDIYTIEAPDGTRDLYLEHGFQELEDKFTRIRNLTFRRNAWPDTEQMVWLLLFVTTAHTRTAAHRNFHAQQWGGILERMVEMDEAMRTATPAQRRAASSVLRDDRRRDSLSMDDVRELAAHPIHHMLEAELRAVLPVMAQMHVAVLRTADELGFVTTDTPCTWFDPDAYRRPPFYRAPGLSMRSIEVTLPISPSQCLLITHDAGCTGFVDINDALLNELNRRHIAHCDQSFIACRNQTRAAWFERPPMPADAWENRGAHEAAEDGPPM